MRRIKFIDNKTGKELLLSSSKPFILGNIDNIASNSANFFDSVGVGQDGITIDSITLKERLIPIEIGIFGKSKEDLCKKRAYLSSFFNPKNSFTLIYTDDAKTRKISCRVQNTAYQKTLGACQNCLIQILCPSPFWESIEEHKTTIALWEGDLEFPLEISEKQGIEVGHRVSNLICNINNRGDVETGMKIQFKALATVVNPSLFNVNTRQFIKINKTLKSGDVLEVITCFDNKKIELVKSNGSRENVFFWLDLDSDFLQLQVGDNLFRYDAENGLDNLEVSIYHTQLFMGV